MFGLGVDVKKKKTRKREKKVRSEVLWIQEKWVNLN